jgi:hypothetical protein
MTCSEGAVANLHPALIRANIALFTGDYAEVRRLLDDYRAAGGGAAEHAPMALWLDAHAQSEPEERLRRLENLLSLVPPDNIYAHLAQSILDLERPAPVEPPRRFTVQRVIIAAVAVVLALVGLYLILPKPQPPAIADASPTATPAPTAAPLPDRSRPLAGVSRANYVGGILQVIAVEDSAQRIVGPDGAQLTPVPGARFYAVELAFECRIAICQNPPEAAIALRLADDSLIAPEERAFVQNETSLSPVALGITTRGWLVFEIPSIVAVSALDVAATATTGEPLVIEMPLE